MHAKFSAPTAAERPRSAPPDLHRLQFRASAAGGAVGAVDAAAGTISRVSLITADREAAGWGLWIDARTVSGFHALLAGRRLKAYATHGTWGKDGTLDEVGYWETPVIDGQHLRANFASLAAWKKHHEDEYDTLFELAEKLPAEFGASVSFRFNAVWVMRDGAELPTVHKWRYTPGEGYEEYWDPPMPMGALREQPSVRPTEVFSADFVDEPAANDGLFRAAPGAGAVDASGNSISSAMLTTKDLHARFGANPAQLARAIALSVNDEKLTLDQIATKIAAEEQEAELVQLRASNKKLGDDAAGLTTQLKAKDDEIARLNSELKKRDDTIAAFQKGPAGGTTQVPVGGNNGGEAGAESNPEAKLRAELNAITGTDAASAKKRGEVVAKLNALKNKKP